MRINRIARGLAMALCAAIALVGCISGNSTPQPAKSGTEQTEKQGPKDSPPDNKEPAAQKAGGQYEVGGYKVVAGGGKAVSESGNQLKNEPIEIKWAVTKETFDKLKEGMSLEEVRKALGLTDLAYTPRGPASQFHLVCKEGEVTVTLIFAGTPEVKLTSKAATGFASDWNYHMLLQYAPVSLLPVKLEGTDQRRPAELLIKETLGALSKDETSQKLLRRLYRADSVVIDVSEKPIEKGFRPEAPPGHEAVYIRLYSNPDDKTPKVADAAYNSRVSVGWFHATKKKPIDGAEVLKPLLFAINDYLLRTRQGWVYNSGAWGFESRGEQLSAVEARKHLDQSIAEFAGRYK